MTDTKKSIIDKATSHFKTVMSQDLLGPIDVPEWDAQIYYRPSSTMAQETKVIELTQAGKTTEALILTLIQRACDENGEAIFHPGDRARLMNAVDPKVILRVVTTMGEEQGEAEQYLGN